MSNVKSTVVGLAISMPLLATSAIVLRFRARRMRKAKIEADDCLAVAALVFCHGLSISALCGVYLGHLGSYMAFNSDGRLRYPEQYKALSQTQWVTQIISIPAIGLAKLSVLFCFQRIFVSHSFKLMARIMVGVVIAWVLTFSVANIVNCSSVVSSWSPNNSPEGLCKADVTALFWAGIITDIATDLIILSLPAPQIWKLQMTRHQKYQAGCMFMLGWMVVGTAVARSAQYTPGFSSSPGNTSHSASVTYWTILEANIGVISACLPTLRPLFQEIDICGLAASLFRLCPGRLSSRLGLIPFGRDENSYLFHRRIHRQGTHHAKRLSVGTVALSPPLATMAFAGERRCSKGTSVSNTRESIESNMNSSLWL
ncbi:hypothetical protein F5Y15DRAFT_124664 [Xylariaceae sp. FL0016]|nr:hypothetical protein F5Y15DRAFT_124664 [Xylariaceae sp. FL0016]